MNNNTKPQTPEATTFVNLRASVFDNGISESDVILIYDALAAYKEVILKNVFADQQQGDIESAASQWADYENLNDLQRFLFFRVSRLAFDNYQTSAGRIGVDKDANRQNAISDYCKFFNIQHDEATPTNQRDCRCSRPNQPTRYQCGNFER